MILCNWIGISFFFCHWLNFNLLCNKILLISLRYTSLRPFLPLLVYLCLKLLFLNRISPFLKTIKEWTAVFLNKVAISTGCQKFNNFSQDTSSILNQTTYNFICYISSTCSQHLFKLSCWEPLNYHIFLCFFSLELFEKILLVINRL